MKKPAEAFTFIETLVSMAIILIISVLLAFCYSSSLKGLLESKIRTKNDLELKEYDRCLRKTINTVSVPEWEKDYSPSFSSSALSLKWYDGCEKISDIALNSRFTIIDCSVIYYKTGRPAGLEIEYLYDDKSFLCRELFSNIPFGQVQL